ncbi:MAG: HlyC/CorC family transporter [Gammaproteobacteria bacterium]|nr:MAG: HlyC/CorC family transporter [Gammaproteobacteria bacterium]
MDRVPLGWLLAALAVLIVASAFFSASETAMMALNRYRLRHLARSGHRGAARAAALLERPDRLIGLILLGNNFVNILASALATVIGLRLLGQAGLAVATGTLTLVILIFAEVTPKTLAVLHPERVAFPAAWVLRPLMVLLYPVVWLTNAFTRGLLALFGVSVEGGAMQQLSREELRTVVHEAGALIPRPHQKMLLNILDLEQETVDDVMVPRNEIVGLDLEEDEEEVLRALAHAQYTRLPLYREHIDQVVGILHVRDALPLLGEGRFSKEALEAVARPCYFVPEGTPLHTQLLQFQRERRRVGLVVDEYGDIKGLVTLDDILEEIVGEFTTEPTDALAEVVPQEDGSYLVDASLSVRELNRLMGWELPTDGPKTLNGLILEHLERIPEPGTSLRIAGYPMEIVQTKGNAVKTVRIHPGLRRPPQAPAGTPART